MNEFNNLMQQQGSMQQQQPGMQRGMEMGRGQQLAQLLQQQQMMMQNQYPQQEAPKSTTDQFKQMAMDWLKGQIQPGAQSANLGGFTAEDASY